MIKDNPSLKTDPSLLKALEQNLQKLEGPKYGPVQTAKDIQIGGDHYKSMPIQPGEFITKNSIPWYEGNAIKYICRHKMKNGRQDLEKAIHYLQLALEEYYET